jgi:hypothetical protein
LFNLSAADPLICLAAAVTMVVMTLLASALPARRAASADPRDALRAQETTTLRKTRFSNAQQLTFHDQFVYS